MGAGVRAGGVGGGEEEVGWVLRKVGFGKVRVGDGELAGVEMAQVGFPRSLDAAGAPAGVEEFPFVGVDADGVPGVVPIWSWDGCAACVGGDAVALAVAGDGEAFQAACAGQGCEEGGVAFADGEAGLER